MYYNCIRSINMIQVSLQINLNVKVIIGRQYLNFSYTVKLINY